MRAMRNLGVLALALMALVVVLAACGNDGGGAGDGSPAPVEGGLPPNFPDDFPLYPDLNIARSYPFGDRYIVQADSEDSAEEIVDFYEKALSEDPWDVLEVQESSDPTSVTFRIIAPGWPLDGRVQVTQGVDNGSTVVGIAVPIDIGEGD